MEHLSDEQIHKCCAAAMIRIKVYAAYKAAIEHKGQPTVILAKTIKGYGLGEAGEGKNITHQQKKLNEKELREFRTRFGIPVPRRSIARTPFFRPPADSPEISYMVERRKSWAVPAGTEGPVEADRRRCRSYFEEFFKGSEGREVSTTMGFVRHAGKLLRDQEIGKHIVPIIPDEARTFGLEALFRQFGIYSSVGQLYEPVDKDSLLYYKEAKDGQILEEGITEAGFDVVVHRRRHGLCHARHQHDPLLHLLLDVRVSAHRRSDLGRRRHERGFLLGGTAGRTTLDGEGLQHQDGHSHVLAIAVPTAGYDPAFMFELAYHSGRNEAYVRRRESYLLLPDALQRVSSLCPRCQRGRMRRRDPERNVPVQACAGEERAKHRAHLLASGPLVNEALKAQELLERKYGVAVTCGA